MDAIGRIGVDVWAVALSFLPGIPLVAACGVCRTFRGIVDTHPAVFSSIVLDMRNFYAPSSQYTKAENLASKRLRDMILRSGPRLVNVTVYRERGFEFQPVIQAISAAATVSSTFRVLTWIYNTGGGSEMCCQKFSPDGRSSTGGAAWCVTLSSSQPVRIDCDGRLLPLRIPSSPVDKPTLPSVPDA